MADNDFLKQIRDALLQMLLLSRKAQDHAQTTGQQGPLFGPRPQRTLHEPRFGQQLGYEAEQGLPTLDQKQQQGQQQGQQQATLGGLQQGQSKGGKLWDATQNLGFNLGGGFGEIASTMRKITGIMDAFKEWSSALKGLLPSGAPTMPPPQLKHGVNLGSTMPYKTGGATPPPLPPPLPSTRLPTTGGTATPSGPAPSSFGAPPEPAARPKRITQIAPEVSRTTMLDKTGAGPLPLPKPPPPGWKPPPSLMPTPVQGPPVPELPPPAEPAPDRRLPKLPSLESLPGPRPAPRLAPTPTPLPQPSPQWPAYQGPRPRQLPTPTMPHVVPSGMGQDQPDVHVPAAQQAAERRSRGLGPQGSRMLGGEGSLPTSLPGAARMGIGGEGAEAGAAGQSSAAQEILHVAKELIAALGKVENKLDKVADAEHGNKQYEGAENLEGVPASPSMWQQGSGHVDEAAASSFHRLGGPGSGGGGKTATATISSVKSTGIIDTLDDIARNAGKAYSLYKFFGN